MTSGSSGFCYGHAGIALPCKEPGCVHRCAVYTKRQYCKEHREIGDRLRRKGFRE